MEKAPSLKPGEVNLGVTNRVTDKLTQIHDRIFCCRSGSAADTQAIADIVHYYLQVFTVQEGQPPTVEVAANMFQRLVYDNKDQLMAGIIIGGWDAVNGPSVYSIPLGGSLHRRPFAIGGSGSSYIYGYCDATYKEGMSREECIAFTKNAVSLAMSRDGSSGGTIRLAIITKDKVERVFVPGNELPVFYEG
ncbi:Proteasome subunit beta type-1 [Polyrhizophydium stewartii]|uniref:proteasome endopeptidase complex n=1 Tax=Polyrhizophydium stewartii TaxID=2732419 RepID=A0ABR4N1Z9_9FUNG